MPYPDGAFVFPRKPRFFLTQITPFNFLKGFSTICNFKFIDLILDTKIMY